jgi:hypothetical protein
MYVVWDWVQDIPLIYCFVLLITGNLWQTKIQVKIEEDVLLQPEHWRKQETDNKKFGQIFFLIIRQRIQICSFYLFVLWLGS